jgi:hypothetical protein
LSTHRFYIYVLRERQTACYDHPNELSQRVVLLKCTAPLPAGPGIAIMATNKLATAYNTDLTDICDTGHRGCVRYATKGNVMVERAQISSDDITVPEFFDSAPSFNLGKQITLF